MYSDLSRKNMKVNKTENDASEFLETQNLGVVVYCASSPQIGQNYFEAAERLGQLFAEQGIAVINGAGKQGLMGALNDSTLAHGGTSIGVIPKFMVDAGWCHESLTRTILTDTIHERKSLMAEISNAAIALPGGIGTLEELAEIITWKQLGLYNKPIFIININGYYDLLLRFLDKMMTEQFMNPDHCQMWKVVSTPEETIELLNNFPAWIPTFSKYDKKEL